jgi:hypothetical protein
MVLTKMLPVLLSWKNMLPPTLALFPLTFLIMVTASGMKVSIVNPLSFGTSLMQSLKDLPLDQFNRFRYLSLASVSEAE